MKIRDICSTHVRMFHVMQNQHFSRVIQLILECGLSSGKLTAECLL